MKFGELYNCLAKYEHFDIDIMKGCDNWYSLEYYKKSEVDINKLKDMEVIKVMSCTSDYGDSGLYVVLKEK